MNQKNLNKEKISLSLIIYIHNFTISYNYLNINNSIDI